MIHALVATLAYGETRRRLLTRRCPGAGTINSRRRKIVQGRVVRKVRGPRPERRVTKRKRQDAA